MSEKYGFLKRCDVFERLELEELKAIESRCRIRKIARNEPVYLPADAADDALVSFGQGRNSDNQPGARCA